MNVRLRVEHPKSKSLLRHGLMIDLGELRLTSLNLPPPSLTQSRHTLRRGLSEPAGPRCSVLSHGVRKVFEVTHTAKDERGAPWLFPEAHLLCWMSLACAAWCLWLHKTTCRPSLSRLLSQCLPGFKGSSARALEVSLTPGLSAMLPPLCRECVSALFDL